MNLAEVGGNFKILWKLGEICVVGLRVMDAPELYY